MRTLSLLATAALALLALPACNRLVGIDDFHLGEDAAIDPPSMTVTGTSILTYLWPGGTQDVAEDLSKYTIAAYIPDTAEPTGFRVIPGVGTVDGKLTIEGVPAGTYYLKLVAPGETAPTFYVTDDRVLDLGHTLAGHPDSVTVGDALVAFDIEVPKGSGAASGELGAYSFGAGAALNDFRTSQGDWTDPARLRLKISWSLGHSLSGGASRRVASTRGDDFYLAHFTEGAVDGASGVGGVYLFRLDKLFESHSVDIDGVSPTTISGTFKSYFLSPLPPVPLVVDVAQYEQAIMDRGSGFERVYEASRVGAPVTPQFSVPNEVSEFAPDQRVAFMSPTLMRVLGIPLWDIRVRVRRASIPKLVTLPRLRYPEALPASWKQYIVESFTASRWIQHPAVGEATGLISFVRSIREPASSEVFRKPMLATTHDITIDDIDAMEGGILKFDSTQPLRVAWAVVPNASRYEVSVVDIYPDGNATAQRVVFSAVTESTAVSIPAANLSAGDFYAISVTAITDAAAFREGALRKFSIPRGDSRLFTGMFRFAPLCGNGQIDPGEDCDGGEGCDVDCTKVDCRDGLKGGAEACDDGLYPSERCHGCLPVKCGDGRYSPNAEDCDLSSPGAHRGGCSTSCLREGSCGDGIVQADFEQCDDGNDVENDECVFCRPHSCGDGFIYNGSSAFEQCDDGNNDPGDGCSAACLFE